ncbi:MAG TPA: carbohydrate ABC transporter permease [Actinobacteria bacterium]|nr:L-arabinose transport system permease protein AraQ [bacterium BMS3Bbin01]HDH25455.1 carbohydrate ABC transporter permease [Actinomycetota bacterium]
MASAVLARRLRRPLLYLTLVVFAVVVVTPFLWTIYASFIESDLRVSAFPTEPGAYGLGNYRFILQQSLMARWYLNSIIVTGTILAGNLILNTMVGYALARINFPGRRVLFVVLLAVMMVPPQILFVPIFILVSRLGWLNTYIGLTAPFIVNPFGAFLMRQYFLGLPDELEDAAKLDGLSHFGILRRIALPLSLPALATQAIFIFVWNWNNFVFPSILATDPSMYTLPVGIYQITTTSFTNQVTKSMAAIVLMGFPTLLVFGALQRHFVRSLTGTGLK